MHQPRLIPDPNAASKGGALVASRIICTIPCKLLAVIVLNTNVAVRYLQVFESATLPADGDVPALPAIPVAAGGATMFQFGDHGVDLDCLTICNSSTAATKTIGGADMAMVAIIKG